MKRRGGLEERRLMDKEEGGRSYERGGRKGEVGGGDIGEQNEREEAGEWREKREVGGVVGKKGRECRLEEDW